MNELEMEKLIGAENLIEDEQDLNSNADIYSEDLNVEKVLRAMPGTMNEITRIHKQSCVVEQEDFAVATAISAASLLYGRLIEIPTGDDRACIFIMAIGKTGSGKEHGRNVLRKLIEILEIDAGLEESIASEPALFNILDENPNLLVLIDEVWKLLKKANSGNNFAVELLAAFMTMYSSSGYAEVKNTTTKSNDPISVAYPGLTAYFTSTFERLADTISAMQSVDGFTNRIMMVESYTCPDIDAEKLITRPKAKQLIAESESLVEIADFFASRSANNPIKVNFTKSGKAAFVKTVDDYNKTNNTKSDEGRALFKRSLENSIRIASLVAVSVAKDYEKPVIDESVMNWAWKYTKFWSNHMAKRFEYGLFDSKHEAARADVIKMLARDKNKAGLTTAQIRNNSRPYKKLSPPEQHALIFQMCEEGEITLEQVVFRNGKMGNKYRLWVEGG